MVLWFCRSRLNVFLRLLLLLSKQIEFIFSLNPLKCVCLMPSDFVDWFAVMRSILQYFSHIERDNLGNLGVNRLAQHHSVKIASHRISLWPYIHVNSSLFIFRNIILLFMRKNCMFDKLHLFIYCATAFFSELKHKFECLPLAAAVIYVII